MPVIIFDLLAFAPELILVISSLLALMAGLFIKKPLVRYLLLFIGFLIAFYQMEPFSNLSDASYFNSSLVKNNFSNFFKLLLLSLGLVNLVIFSRSSLPSEVSVLMTISTLSLMLLVSSNDFITLYLTMELSGLCFYIMVASQKNSKEGTEASIKYLILAAFVSLIYLLGVTILASWQGHFAFQITRLIFDFQPLVPISILFIVTALFFKLGAAPLHLWLADLYQGAPWQVTAFLATASKIAALAMLMKFMIFFKDLLDFTQILTVVGVLSIFLGGLAAIRQENLKRLLAYSSVSNLGLVLLVFSLQSDYSFAAGLFYFLIYSLLLFLPSFILVGIISSGSSHFTLQDLAKLRETNPIALLFLNIMLLALAGLPPFAGFFGKLYLLMTLIQEQAWDKIAIFLMGAIFSVIYSIRVIKASYFEEGKFIIKRGPYPWPSREIFIFTLLGLINLSLSVYSSQILLWIKELLSL